MTQDQVIMLKSTLKRQSGRNKSREKAGHAPNMLLEQKSSGVHLKTESLHILILIILLITIFSKRI